MQLFPILPKIHFESKSQLQFGLKVCSIVVSYSAKVTFWKQITTPKTVGICIKMLFLTRPKLHFESKSQLIAPTDPPMTELFLTRPKLHFESKSQPYLCSGIRLSRCFLLGQSYILKANHNGDSGDGRGGLVVSYSAKVTFWKQITTSEAFNPIFPALFLTRPKLLCTIKSIKLCTPNVGCNWGSLHCYGWVVFKFRFLVIGIYPLHL